MTRARAVCDLCMMVLEDLDLFAVDPDAWDGLLRRLRRLGEVLHDEFPDLPPARETQTPVNWLLGVRVKARQTATHLLDFYLWGDPRALKWADVTAFSLYADLYDLLVRPH